MSANLYTLSDEKLLREFRRAAKASERAAAARSKLPPGSSRARVTTANAKWARAAEFRELLRSEIISRRLGVPELPL